MYKTYEHEGALFSELKEGKPVLIAREASFIHRRGITKDDLKLMKENFDNNILGLRVNFDYNHKDDDVAAGWIKSIDFGEVEVDGKKLAALFAVPEWTPRAKQAIKDGEYSYTSPEIFWEWLNPESGKKFKSVLRSVAILNRPQIPGQPTIKFSEAKIKQEETKVDKVKKMLEEKFGAKFSDEAVSEDTVISKFTEIIKSKDEAAEKTGKELEDLKAKFATLEATKSADEKELAKFKEQIDKIETDRKAEKVEALVEVAKTKMPPAMAEGMFRSLAVANYDEAKKDLDAITDTFGDTKGTGSANNPAEVSEIDKEVEGVSKMKATMAAEQGVKVSEISTAEAYSAYDALKKKEAK